MYFITHTSDGIVTAIYHNPEHVKDILEGFEVEEIPQPESNGMIPILKVNIDTNELFYDYVQPPKTENEKIIDLETELTNTQLALADTYEQLLSTQDENTNTQLALVDVYEQLLALQGGTA